MVMSIGERHKHTHRAKTDPNFPTRSWNDVPLDVYARVIGEAKSLSFPPPRALIKHKGRHNVHEEYHKLFV